MRGKNRDDADDTRAARRLIIRLSRDRDGGRICFGVLPASPLDRKEEGHATRRPTNQSTWVDSKLSKTGRRRRRSTTGVCIPSVWSSRPVLSCKSSPSRPYSKKSKAYATVLTMHAPLSGSATTRPSSAPPSHAPTSRRPSASRRPMRTRSRATSRRRSRRGRWWGRSGASSSRSASGASGR